MNKANQLCAPQKIIPAKINMHPTVKESIDEIRGYSLLGSVHTTDSLSAGQRKRMPENPKPFPAGRYKVVFEKKGDAKALWVNTEESVGHFETITPGVTEIRGSVQLGPDSKAEAPVGPKLNDEEIDYLIAALYSRFCTSLDSDAATRLNRLKDMLLAVRFSRKAELEAYHLRLLGQLK
jgi:hypothetical protein